VCALLIVITHFYLEFHASLNNYNTKPANIKVQWGSVDHLIALCEENVLRFERAPVRHAKKFFFIISPKKFRSFTKKYVVLMFTQNATKIFSEPH